MASSKKVSPKWFRQPEIEIWNFDAIYHSYRDITTSGLGGHIAISGCQSLSQWLRNTFFDVDVVGKLDFVTWVTTILIPDLFCHSSQHDHKISPVWKKSLVYDVMPNNFRCTDWRPDSCILYPLHIQEKSPKDDAQRWTEFFLLIQKLSLGFFNPISIGRLNLISML